MARPPRQRFPRKGTPEGRPGVDRKPVRLWRTEARYCPAAAKWVGPGSKFDNPFRSKPLLAREAARVTRYPKREAWGPFGGMEPVPASPGEIALGAAWLFREWRAGRLDTVPQHIAFRLREAGVADLVPPTDQEIRAALRGFDLADKEPHHYASHADELLRVANSDAPDLFEEPKP